MMSWDCNTSQSIFNAGMSFRYDFFFGRIIMRFTIVLEYCFLLFICFFFISVSVFTVHHFSFFRHSLHVIVFFLAKMQSLYTGWVWNICFCILIYVLFQIIESAGVQRDANCDWNAHWTMKSVLAKIYCFTSKSLHSLMYIFFGLCDLVWAWASL